MFKTLIMAKKRFDSGSYTSAVSFNIEAKQFPSPSLSYPKTWQLFHDLGLKIEARRNRSSAIWPANASYAEVLIQALDDVTLSCAIKYDNVKIENGSLGQLDNDKKLWQPLFTSESTDPHELIVYAKQTNDSESFSEAVFKFNLDVTKLRRSMKFSMIYTHFQTKKCRIYTPMDGILKKGSVVSIDCVIPDAIDVTVAADL
jgi:hypothetical protein